MGGIPSPGEPWENLGALLTAPEPKNGELFPLAAEPLTSVEYRADAKF
jgi:hypothetical protein